MSVKTVDYAEVRDPKTNGKNFSLVASSGRVREPVTRSKGRVVGRFPSAKNQASISWESQLELKAIRLLEYCDSVVSYREQPRLFSFLIDGVQKRYYPDFEVILSCGQRIYVEVKPKRRLLSQPIKAKYLAIADALEELGEILCFITDSHVANDALQQNITLIHPYNQVDIKQEDIELLRVAFKESETSFGALISSGVALKTLYSAIAKGLITIDLLSLISLESNCIYNEEGHHENRIFTCWFASDLR